MSRRELALVALAFTVLTWLVTYPQVLQLSSHVGAHYDALFGIWRMAWIAHQALEDPRHLFDGNIFYPERNTLAYSDAALLLGLSAAPLIWLGIKPVVVYNLFVLGSFVASGTAMYALARRLTGAAAPAWIAGLIFAYQQYRYAHFPQIETLWTCWIPLALLALHDLLETRRVRSGVALGMAFSLQALSCLYYAVFLATGLGILLIAHLVRARRDVAALVKPLLAAAAIVVMVCGPYALPYLAARESIGLRSEQDVLDWSPSVWNYLATTRTSIFYKDLPARVGHIEGVLFPGFIAVALAALGLATAPRRHAIGYAVLMCVAFDVSLGMNGVLFPVFREALLPYQGLRVPGRMFVMVSAAMCVLAAYGIARLQQLWRGASQRTILAALGVVVVFEGLSIPLPLDPVPTTAGDVYAFLAVQPRTTVLEWPMPRPDRLGYTEEPRRMYVSTTHWQRLVNGYSGHYPPSYIEVIHLIGGFPDAASLDVLRQRRVRYVVLHSGPDPDAYQRVLRALRTDRNYEVMQSERLDDEEVTIVRIRGI